MIIHLILNAHLDPVWLWPWHAGLDEALATCRSACDRLDRHPDIVFTRGEAWVYRQIERVDPALFARICRHIEAGRWEIVGGWWIQPDCNLPSGFALERQIEIGRRYFLDRFGLFPGIAYNVDSFGHAATLPGYLRAAGQDNYIMMRPAEHEMALPARLFRWRGYEGGPKVTVFRIAHAYNMPRFGEYTLHHFEQAITELPPGVEHTMAFVGIGDHGGGPSERQIAWCREHAQAIPGCEFVFSSPSRFFQAIAPHVDSLPLVTGELQIHAMGCYSVYRPIKTAVRRAEHLLIQAEHMGTPPAELEKAWEHVCFNHFHDTLGGTCIPSAYPQVEAQLGAALAAADEALHVGLRRKLNDLPDDSLQRIVLHNASGDNFAGYVEIEPWLEWQPWQPSWRLVDPEGQQIPFQQIQSEALAANISRLLFRTEVPVGEYRIVRIERDGFEPIASRVDTSPGTIRTSDGVVCGPDSFTDSFNFLGLPPLSRPQLELIDDPSDTWSHAMTRYGDTPADTAHWENPQIADRGPLMASMSQDGRIGASRLEAEWRVYDREPFVEFRLVVHWTEKHKVLKLILPFPAPCENRIDGIMGGNLRRENDGRELPIRDWTLLLATAGEPLGVVCPDIFGADATPQRARFTLLRSSIMAHHEPHSGTSPRAVISDQGTHTFKFRFFYGQSATPEILERQSFMWHRPLVTADVTRGMPL